MKVLIVDDEPLVRRSLGRALRSRGHDVFEATDGRLGLKEWRQCRPDLVFLDVLMPEMTGPEVLREVEAEDAAKVIMMSAFSGEGEGSRDFGPRVHFFLQKPFENIFEIAEMAERLVAGDKG